jgi:haloalkane dehalogenase
VTFTRARRFGRGGATAQEATDLNVGRIVDGGCMTELSAQVIAGYDAPFLDESFKADARQFPMPTSPDDPAVPANRAAWVSLGR